MDLKAEKKLLVSLGAAALAVVLLLPFVFRELEPDYEAAYGMDAAKKRRFAAKDEAPPVVADPPSAPAPAASSSGGAAPDDAPHRLPPRVGRARIATPDTPDASSAPDIKDPAAAAARPRLVAGESGGAGGRGAAAAGDAGYDALEDARFTAPGMASAPKLMLVSGAADAAAAASRLGMKDVAGLALSAGDALGVNSACADAARELRPRIASASAEHKRATDEFKASACPADACGRYAADCAAKERTDEEARVARRRCACDRLACRVRETCRALDELTCEQEKACSQGKPASCVPRC